MWFTEGNGNRIGRLGAVSAPIDTYGTQRSTHLARRGQRVRRLGGEFEAGYDCADEAAGSGLAECVGPVIDGEAIDTSIGSHRFEVNASDVQGNTTTASTGYIVFSDLGGSLATPTTRRAGFWETLDLGLGLTRPADALLFVAPATHGPSR